MLRVRGLSEWRERLERVRVAEVIAAALAAQAEVMAAAVREGLSDAPGEGAHERPWVCSGALRESVGVVAEGLRAVVGSSDPAAGPQEFGTVHDPARPFLAPVAGAMGADVAQGAADAVVAALNGTPADDLGIFSENRKKDLTTIPEIG